MNNKKCFQELGDLYIEFATILKARGNSLTVVEAIMKNIRAEFSDIPSSIAIERMNLLIEDARKEENILKP